MSGGGATETTISGLAASTTYSIEVAAVNSTGTGSGVYSVPTATETDAECTCSYMLISCGYKGYPYYTHVSGDSLGARLHKSSIHYNFCMVVFDDRLKCSFLH